MIRLFQKNSAEEKVDPQRQEDLRLLREIHLVKERIKAVESLYNLTCDSDMIDCYIHEINALDAQYRFLLRSIRERGLQCPSELFRIENTNLRYKTL